MQLSDIIHAKQLLRCKLPVATEHRTKEIVVQYAGAKRVRM